ncbi:hypothetical protein STRNTR1_1332 [Stenotrophomonas maltophilia]|nr:hypothetical protein STRNTR1_1332 [Stenotrophomonas maltophilia]
MGFIDSGCRAVRRLGFSACKGNASSCRSPSGPPRRVRRWKLNTGAGHNEI